MNFKKKFILGIFICLFAAFLTAKPAYAIPTVNGGNYTSATAYDMGRYTNLKSVTGILPAQETCSYFKFTVNADEKIYIRCSHDKSYTKMAVEWRDAADYIISKSTRVLDASTLTPFLAVNCDGKKNGQTFYIKVNRGDYDINKPMYFSVSLNNRIKSGSGTFSFTGSAVNRGNSSMSYSGVDSSIIKLNLSRESKIPAGAIVTRVSTKSTQSPSQGNVHHILMPESVGNWYTSKVSSATSGSYNISEKDKIPVKQVWKFKYNAKASKKSTMNNVKLNVDWTYDLANTGYKVVL